MSDFLLFPPDFSNPGLPDFNHKINFYSEIGLLKRFYWRSFGSPLKACCKAKEKLVFLLRKLVEAARFSWHDSRSRPSKVSDFQAFLWYDSNRRDWRLKGQKAAPTTTAFHWKTASSRATLSLFFLFAVKKTRKLGGRRSKIILELKIIYKRAIKMSHGVTAMRFITSYFWGKLLFLEARGGGLLLITPWEENLWQSEIAFLIILRHRSSILNAK